MEVEITITTSTQLIIVISELLFIKWMTGRLLFDKSAAMIVIIDPPIPVSRELPSRLPVSTSHSPSSMIIQS